MKPKDKKTELERLREFDGSLLFEIARIENEIKLNGESEKLIHRLVGICEQHSDCLKAIASLALPKGMAL